MGKRISLVVDVAGEQAEEKGVQVVESEHKKRLKWRIKSLTSGISEVLIR